MALCVFAGSLLVLASPALAAKEYAQVGFFGSKGSGNGQLKEPTGLAVNGSLMEAAAGDVYVIDTGNARVEQFSSTGAYISQWNGGETPAKSFLFSSTSDSQGIAVDSSSNPLDPSAGDVYVADVGHNAVDQFGASGTYVGQLTGTCAAPGTCPGEVIPFPGELLGVAVDPSGNLWVYESRGNADEFSDTGAFVQSFNTGAIETNQGTAPGLAVDASNGAYTVFGDHHVQKFENGNYVAVFGTHEVTALTANPATAEVLLDQGSSIERFGQVTGEEQQPPLETFAGGGLFESHGIAVNGAASATGTVYASQRGADDVEIFEYASFPGLSATFSGVSETGVTLEGTVSPKGEAITACKFEYGTTVSYGQSVPCEQTLEEINKAGEAAAVSAKLSGLTPAVTRHFRLDAANANGTKHGKDVLISRPVVERESFSNVGSGEASVAAEIDAEGLPTSYRVEYGPSEEFGFSTPAVNIGAPKGAVPVQVQLSGLQPGAEYHFRFVATDALGTAGGSAMTFSTSQSVALTAQTLPDNRAYELVSNPEDTEVYPPSYEEPILAAGEFFGIPDHYRAAANGDAVAYMGDPPASGVTGSGATGAGLGNQYLATRTAKGWEASDLEVAGGGEAGLPEWRPFAADLSVWTLNTNIPITAEPQAPAGCQERGALYSRTTSGFHSLVASQKPGQCYAQSGGISGDGSHILLYSPYAYTSLAVEGAEFQKTNLYDSVGGQLHQVNVLPDGEPEPHPYAMFGIGEESNFGGDISADGSRVFWKDQNTEVTPEDPAGTTRLFVRKNDAQPQSPLGPKGECAVAGDACTVQMDAAQGGSGTSGGGVFRASSSDGSRAFFTAESQLTAGSTAGVGEPDLYEYDVNTGVLTDLTLAKAGAHANVQGVIGASEDGSYVYFVADGVLTQGANGEGKEPVSGQPNVYMLHNGVTTFIVTLSPNDNNIRCCSPSWGDWQSDIGARTAEVAPGGHAVTFMSRLSLTGYDNANQPEVFVYETGAGRIFCASCNPGGAPLVPAAEDWENEHGGYVGLSGGAISEVQHWSSFQLHFINEAGTQVFFMTAQPLVPQDTNKRQDVYEWESDGSGGCPQVGGCVGLLSSGSSPNPAFFVDASASGGDVFFTSRAQLVPGSVDEAVKLYDARVNGGFSELSLACTGTGCQGVPPAPPIFATPSSVTFNGVGNFEASASGKAVTPRRRTAAQVRAEKLARALKACKKRAKKKRAVCEKTARRRYAPAKKKGKR
jgi:hypothetical protein